MIINYFEKLKQKNCQLYLNYTYPAFILLHIFINFMYVYDNESFFFQNIYLYTM